ncbi:prepilin-type N-terminal cleavage/methylation domain-containing protein [Synergistaceae bacterium OttesenSCG-928-D05]|nr:prepilin-type N-terminal cleavage/methylation domain-containing protein [Synergistaceae bacterium OttesenSCG-928-D05]
MKRAQGFTLIEVMVAVVVLSLVATASLKLVIMAQNGLAEAREREKLLDESLRVQMDIRLGKIRSSGKSGDVEWKIEDKEKEFFGEDFGRLQFGQSEDNTSNQVRFDIVKWKEVEVTTDNERKIMLYLPHHLETMLASEDAASGDEEQQNGRQTNKRN